jgi:hypothetical protein
MNLNEVLHGAEEPESAFMIGGIITAKENNIRAKGIDRGYQIVQIPVRIPEPPMDITQKHDAQVVGICRKIIGMQNDFIGGKDSCLKKRIGCNKDKEDNKQYDLKTAVPFPFHVPGVPDGNGSG